MSDPQPRDGSARLRATVLVTIFNDWAAFEMLLDELSAQPVPDKVDIDVVAVDDASRENHDKKRAILVSCPLALTILTLARNLGNQRALAIGLCHIVTRTACDFIIVMDGDGEDRPSDVPTLLGNLLAKRNSIVTAQRHRRSERLSYRIFYVLYKALFRLLTGQIIDFGNFSAMSFESAEQLCSMHELFLSYPAAILASRLPLHRVRTARGKRYMGRSGISYLGLAVHGLSSIAVFSDRVLARMLASCGMVFAVGLLAIIAALLAKVVGVATPGWATLVIGLALAVLFQVVVAATTALLIVLNSRQAQSMLPRQFGELFIKQIDYSETARAMTRTRSTVP